MMRRVALVLLLAPAFTAPATAGLFNFGGKKPDPPVPAVRVPDLIHTLQTDGDEDKRLAAAEELRDYDPTVFPDLVPALIDALLNDKKPSVRAEAAQSLAKIRPISDQVGMALEQSLAQDASMRVRLQDRSVLLQYRWCGYKTPAPKKDDIPTARPKEPPPPQSKEPPLAPPGGPAIPPPPPLNTQASPPPLPPPFSATPRPLPPGPAVPMPPAPAGNDRGPDLNPPG